ncbi:MAG: YHS domain-containing protein [Bacteroidota bacterium]|nr:YHS domain-containing protein [Bacteroidota bacterium]MDP4251224.1 YHS domain-containing protein [Bacteroidota bacterium]
MNTLKKRSILRNILPASFVASAILLLSCNPSPKQDAAYKSRAYAKSDTAKAKFTRDMVDNIRDPSCGMPLSKAVEDTLHYGGKVYGFCSDECRDEFIKDPEKLAKSAVMKK